MGKRKRDSEPRKDGRPKRTLVRWDQDLDIQLLLSIQAACNANQVKIPWEKVATLMGEKFTDGSIIQHLSKMRIRREAEGKPCPPPLRRSVAPATKKVPSKGKKTRGGDEDDDDDDYDDNDDDLFVGSQHRQDKKDPDWLAPPKGGKGRSRKRKDLGSKGRKSSPKANEEYGLGDNSDSSLSDLSDDEERLCVGFPFLELPGKKGDESDKDRSTETSESPSYAQPRRQATGAQNSGGKKIVRFSVPSAALQALEETGAVGARSNSDQISMPTARPSMVSYNTASFGMGHPVMTSPRPAPTGMTYPPPQNIAASGGYPAQVNWSSLSSAIPPGYGYGYGQQSQQSQQRRDDNMTDCINPSLLTRRADDLGENENHAWPNSPELPSTYSLPYSPRGSRGAGPGWTS